MKNKITKLSAKMPTLQLSDYRGVQGDPSTRTSTSIGNNETESLELIKAVVAGNKAKNETPTQKTEK